MNNKRDNCIILLIEDPAPGNINPEFVAAFGAERAALISLNLLQNAYKLAKNFTDAILIISFEKSPLHPDLTWLDSSDPGFLETKGKSPEDRAADAFRLAFNTGSKKVILLSHLSPAVKPEWLAQTFDSITDKTIALGPNQDGSVYIAGLTSNNFKILEGVSFSSNQTADELSLRAKKNKLSVFSLPEAFAIKNEEALHKWLDAGNLIPSLILNSPASAGVPAAQPAARRPEEKKHHRRAHKNSFPPPSQPDTGLKPL